MGTIKRQLKEVKRDIQGMLNAPLTKELFRDLMQARRYRRELESKLITMC